MKKFFIAAAFGLAALAQANAADRSWYIGADVGRTTFKYNGETDGQTGFGALVGYQFNENLAFEGAWRRLASQNVDGGKINANAVQISALGMLPISMGFTAYARLGLTHNMLDVTETGGGTESHNSDAAVVALGVQYQVMPKLNLRAEYADLGNNKYNLGGARQSVRINQFNVGLNYSF